MFEAGGLEDIYALRTRALDEPVGKAEFSRSVLHLAQRRGFKSNRRTASDGEDGRLSLIHISRRNSVFGMPISLFWFPCVLSCLLYTSAPALRCPEIPAA